MNSDLNNIHQWLVANVDKTGCMIIVKQVSSKKVLGVIIDDKLRWSEQIDNTTKNATQGIGVLRRAKLFVKQDKLQFLYNSLIQPYFEYCSLV